MTETQPKEEDGKKPRLTRIKEAGGEFLRGVVAYTMSAAILLVAFAGTAVAYREVHELLTSKDGPSFKDFLSLLQKFSYGVPVEEVPLTGDAGPTPPAPPPPPPAPQPVPEVEAATVTSTHHPVGGSANAETARLNMEASVDGEPYPGIAHRPSGVPNATELASLRDYLAAHNADPAQAEAAYSRGEFTDRSGHRHTLWKSNFRDAPSVLELNGKTTHLGAYFSS